jgi:hypothetical protein
LAARRLGGAVQNEKLPACVLRAWATAKLAGPGRHRSAVRGLRGKFRFLIASARDREFLAMIGPGRKAGLFSGMQFLVPKDVDTLPPPPLLLQ